ncbi:LamG-like jellyroll fold domain-containing protein [Bremerella alba]|uniref:3',5'-cyclic adenosine monophosphate phosphodiesterase CpdA n=1 Tax=Bremerella alba TaxID=980252 RepID=A0A7V8V296_9BACT|nr:LamG-like jellyroll fold domain-containing protein [Bremerella alba]MBA2113635.1 3',5'-cyclic adenosine monophosphate phosphodiesterase CpdA [Bremerella alba]
MTKFPLPIVLLTAAVFATASQFSQAHEGPDPLARWRFDSQGVVTEAEATTLRARRGPDGTVLGKHQMLGEKYEEALFLSGKMSGIVLAEDHNEAAKFLPSESLTVSVVVSVDRPEKWGGLVGVIQDNGSNESGWLLGYDQTTFTFALRGDNGPGKLTYLKGTTKYESGKLYHVVAVYDGKTMQLYVNGKLDAETTAQSGPIHYPGKAPFMIGAYRDDNEFHSQRGRIRDVVLYDLAAKKGWVEHDYEHNADLAKLPPVEIHEPLDFVIDPYLQFGTQTTMTVMWRSNRPAMGTLFYGETAQCPQRIDVADLKTVHEIRIEDLQPETQYFYRTETRLTEEGPPLLSEVATFQTAVHKDTPFAFAVISDTQGNPTVSGKLAGLAWEQRPSFLLHPGDLVSVGPDDSHWTQHFFPSMNPLIRHVPFYPVLGNHERNAQYYYDYVSLPSPEYYYTYRFGNAQFFMIDSNRNVDPESEQYKWLEKTLSESDAAWKFVCHHHPPYSSDENDYGNLWKTNKGTRGDTKARQLVPLYEKYHVDIVWNGHIHSYERTWPILENKAVNQGGPVYMITGGGGGPLETPGPIRPFFMNTVRRGHHYAMVRINGAKLEFQAYDLDNRMFDQMVIEKKTGQDQE